MDSAYRDAKLKAGKDWSFTVSKLMKDKTKTVYVKAVDNAGNTSAPVAVKIRRM